MCGFGTCGGKSTANSGSRGTSCNDHIHLPAAGQLYSAHESCLAPHHKEASPVLDHRIVPHQRPRILTRRVPSPDSSGPWYVVVSGLSAEARVEYVNVVLVDVVATADKRRDDVPLVSLSIRCTNVAQCGRRPTSNELLAVRSNCCSPRLFRGLSAAARVEYVLVALVDVVATADKRREDVPLVCPSVAQMSRSAWPPTNE
jgi:hypothetical protein